MSTCELERSRTHKSTSLANLRLCVFFQLPVDFSFYHKLIKLIKKRERMKFRDFALNQNEVGRKW